MIKTFNVDNGKVVGLRDTDMSGAYSIDCGDNEQMFRDANCPDRVVYDAEADVVRFKTERETVDESKPSVKNQLSAALQAYIYGKYDAGEQASLLALDNRGNQAQKDAIGLIWAWIFDVIQKGDYALRLQALGAAKTKNELAAAVKGYDFSNNDATKPAYSYMDIMLMG